VNDDLGTVTLVAGAVGEPGQRTFYLQAQGSAEPITIKCEKQQVAALADHIERLISSVPSAATTSTSFLPMDLIAPLEPRFVLGTIGLGWDDGAERVVVMLEEIAAELDEDADPDDTPPRDTLRLNLTRATAEAFCNRARELMAAGRPTCRWCGHPIDPEGHACPRMN